MFRSMGALLCACVILCTPLAACVASGCPDGQDQDGGDCVGAEQDDAGAAALDAAIDAPEGRPMPADAGSGLAAHDAEPPDAAPIDVPDASADAAEADAGPCDGAMPMVCYGDDDGDGHARSDAPAMTQCGACGAGTTDVAPAVGAADCSDSDDAAHPGAAELCNDFDDDCDGRVDEGAEAACLYANASGACTEIGLCSMGACDAGFGDCDEDHSNGCEQSLDEMSACGACGVACDADFAVCEGRGPACSCVAPAYGDGVECHGLGPLSAGGNRSCAIGANAQLECWGAGPETGVSNPVQGTTFRQISVGTEHSCGVRFDGRVVCWGSEADNDYGEANPPGEDAFVQVVVGRDHSCGLEASGRARCWGVSSGVDDFGQADVPFETFRQLSAGLQHTCGIKLDGSVVCWGRGQAVTGACGGVPAACGQSVAPAGQYMSIAAGGVHTCALTLAGEVVCWGAGTADGGTGGDFGQANPPAGSFVQLAAGMLHTCAITAAGAVRCWGAGDADGGTLIHHGQAVPPEGLVARHLAAGGLHTCALNSDDDVVCWGLDDQGQAPDAVIGPFPSIPSEPQEPAP